MSPIPSEVASLSIGALVGVVTSLQPPISQELGILGALFGSPIGSAIIAAAVAYGVISKAIERIERDTTEMKADLKGVATRVARIEGKLESEP